MVSRVTAACLAVLLSLPACGFAAPKIDSVQALQENGITFCSTFSINEREGYWATAGHCAAYALEQDLMTGGTTRVTIMGHVAWVVYSGFPYQDLAVFQSEAKAPALKLAEEAVPQCIPTVAECESIHIIGFPYGITRTTTRGFMGARNIAIRHPSTQYTMTSDILDVTVAGGNSGSPVMDSKGRVIGLLWGGFVNSPHSIAVPWAAVKQGLAVFGD